MRHRLTDALPGLHTAHTVFPDRDEALEALLASPKLAGDSAGDGRERALRAAREASAKACARWRSVGELVSGRRGKAEEGSGTGVGASGGQVIHRAMERLDLTAPRAQLIEAAPSLVRALAEEAGLSVELGERCVTITLRLLQHPVLDEVRAAPEHWKETPFTYRDRVRIVAGVIDLCFPEDASRTRWVVVDWKSDAPPPGHPLRTAYEEQLALYAKALIRTVVPCEHVRTVLAGPFPELTAQKDAAEAARDEALENVNDAVRPMLEALLAAGVPIPRVGADTGEPVITELELAWDTAKVGLALRVTESEEAALAKQGWKLVRATAVDPVSLERASEALAKLLDLTLDGEVARDNQPEGEDVVEA